MSFLFEFGVEQKMNLILQEILKLKETIEKSGFNIQPAYCPNIPEENLNPDLPEIFRTYPRKYQQELLVLKVKTQKSGEIKFFIGWYDITLKLWKTDVSFFGKVMEIAPLPFA